ncbi:MAG: formate-dependent phosphoribosylglycinamide formyltransferase [Sphingorhabdus sp.]
MSHIKKIMLLGSGELGREFVISAKRLGAYVVACDAYDNAPAMQLADVREVFSMLDEDALRSAIDRHDPDLIVPEIEAIRTSVLADVEAEGRNVIPCARAAQLTMNRDAIRDMAAKKLGLRTSGYEYAETREEALAAGERLGFPLVIKPVMSSSGKGQSTAKDARALGKAWDYAVANMRGDRARVIVERFVDFDYEITLLTVRTRDGIRFCRPIGHRQERGDYQESWQPANMKAAHFAEAQAMAERVVEALCADNDWGYGLFGVEFFVCADGVIFSELSPRPHDTGMVTLISQQLNQFDLHVRAILGLPIPHDDGLIAMATGAAASAVILADRDSEDFSFAGMEAALALGSPEEAVDLRLFGKPVTRPYRRMGVMLATGANTDAARKLATKAAAKITIGYR